MTIERWMGPTRDRELEEREELVAPKKEGRMVSAKVEVRADGGMKTIVGYGAVFNVETVIAGYFREQIMPGAFAGLLRSDVRSLFNHDPNYVLGRTAAGTLTISEDAIGLLYTVTPPASRADVVEALERGDVTGSSFGFTVKRDEWTRPSTAGELPLRTIWEVEDLLDVGPVTFPAYDETCAEARNAAAAAAAPPAKDPTDVNARERMRHQLDLLDTEAL